MKSVKSVMRQELVKVESAVKSMKSGIEGLDQRLNDVQNSLNSASAAEPSK
jgi:hypothetical protein